MGLERQQGHTGPWDHIRCLGFSSLGRRDPQQGWVWGDPGRCKFWKDPEGALWSRGREAAVREEEGRAEGEWAACLLPTQQKLTELQAGKKSLEDQVEVLRIVKEEAEKPEKEAKDRHQKLWEGMSRGGHDLPLARGREESGPRRLAHHLSVLPADFFDQGASVSCVPSCL